jgi:hypothetical protein
MVKPSFKIFRFVIRICLLPAGSPALRDEGTNFDIRISDLLRYRCVSSAERQRGES